MMNINIYHWDRLSSGEKQALLKRAESDISPVLDSVKNILADVKVKGDEALIRYTKEFDHADISALGLRVTESELKSAEKEIFSDLKKAIQFSVENVRRFHENQRPGPMLLDEIRSGVYAGERFTPIASAGLYVPRGRGKFPSVMYMLAVPAQIAGVERIAVVTPPDNTGRVDPAVLYAARLCGIDEIYRVGGAQGMAALAYGTESIKRVDKILGPGSIYVSAAKTALTGIVDIGLPAGPSESLILADDSADPEKAALDLITEAEHGADSSAYLVTPSSRLAQAVRNILPSLLQQVESVRAGWIQEVLTGFGGIIITSDMEQAVAFVNDYAAEHLQINCSDAFDILSKIKNAGEILLGEHSAFSLANYSVGPDNVLPTGGWAKTCSPLTVRDFLKSSSVVYISQNGVNTLEKSVVTLAEYEDFSAHALAVKNRRKK